MRWCCRWWFRVRPTPDGRARDDRQAVSQLTADELALIKQKIPNWDELNPRKQEGIARHVLRLRAMSPEERERFQERMERMREAKRRRGVDGTGPLDPRGHERGGRDRGDHPSVVMAVFGQAIESMLRADWPAGAQLADEHKWSGARLAGSFVRHALMRRVGEFELAQAEAADPDTFLAEVPEGRRAKLKSLLEKATSGEPRVRALVGRMLFHVHLHAMRGVMKPAGSQDITQESVTARVVSHIRARWSTPYAQALDDVRGDVEAFVKRVETPRGSMRAMEWVSLAVKLEDVATRSAKDDPALAKDADALFVRILRDRLKIPADKIEALPPRGTPQRRRAVRMLFGDRFGMGRPGMGGRGNAGNRRGGRPFGKDRKKQKPDRKKPDAADDE